LNLRFITIIISWCNTYSNAANLAQYNMSLQFLLT